MQALRVYAVLLVAGLLAAGSLFRSGATFDRCVRALAAVLKPGPQVAWSDFGRSETFTHGEHTFRWKKLTSARAEFTDPRVYASFAERSGRSLFSNPAKVLTVAFDANETPCSDRPLLLKLRDLKGRTWRMTARAWAARDRSACVNDYVAINGEHLASWEAFELVSDSPAGTHPAFSPFSVAGASIQFDSLGVQEDWMVTRLDDFEEHSEGKKDPTTFSFSHFVIPPPAFKYLLEFAAIADQALMLTSAAFSESLVTATDDILLANDTFPLYFVIRAPMARMVLLDDRYMMHTKAVAAGEVFATIGGIYPGRRTVFLEHTTYLQEEKQIAAVHDVVFSVLHPSWFRVDPSIDSVLIHNQPRAFVSGTEGPIFLDEGDVAPYAALVRREVSRNPRNGILIGQSNGHLRPLWRLAGETHRPIVKLGEVPEGKVPSDYIVATTNYEAVGLEYGHHRFLMTAADHCVVSDGDFNERGSIYSDRLIWNSLESDYCRLWQAEFLRMAGLAPIELDHTQRPAAFDLGLARMLHVPERMPVTYRSKTSPALSRSNFALRLDEVLGWEMRP